MQKINYIAETEEHWKRRGERNWDRSTKFVETKQRFIIISFSVKVKAGGHENTQSLAATTQSCPEPAQQWRRAASIHIPKFTTTEVKSDIANVLVPCYIPPNKTVLLHTETYGTDVSIQCYLARQCELLFMLGNLNLGCQHSRVLYKAFLNIVTSVLKPRTSLIIHHFLVQSMLTVFFVFFIL